MVRAPMGIIQVKASRFDNSFEELAHKIVELAASYPQINSAVNLAQIQAAEQYISELKRECLAEAFFDEPLANLKLRKELIKLRYFKWSTI